MGAAGRNHYPVARADDLRTMAVERGLGNRHAGRHQHDLQRRRTSDDVMDRAQGDRHDIVIEVSGLGLNRPLFRVTRFNRKHCFVDLLLATR